MIGRQTGTQTETDEERDTQTDRSYDNLIQYLGVIVQMSVCLSVSVSPCESLSTTDMLSNYLSVTQSVCVSVCLSVSVSVWLSVCVSVCLSQSHRVRVLAPLICCWTASNSLTRNSCSNSVAKLFSSAVGTCHWIPKLCRSPGWPHSWNTPNNMSLSGSGHWASPLLKHTKQYVTIWVRSVCQPTPKT